MMSLITGRDQRMQLPGEEDWYAHDGDLDSCYSNMLHSVIVDCLNADPNKRIDLKSLLVSIKEGLAKWESVYGTANRNADAIPFYMSYDLKSKDQFPIGAKAPDHYGWPKKRKSEEVAEALIDPALYTSVRPPSPKKAWTVEDTKSETSAGRLLATIAGLAAASPSPAEHSRTMLGTQSGKGDLSKTYEEIGDDMFKSESSEEIGGIVIKSLRDKQAERTAREAKEKRTDMTDNKDITRELRAELVKQEVAVKNLEYKAVDGDDDLQIAS
jgi:hypothetical protein